MQRHPNKYLELNMESGGQMVGTDDGLLREMAIMTLCWLKAVATTGSFSGMSSVCGGEAIDL